MFSRILTLLAVLVLAGCGMLPRPFQGNPGANAVLLSQPPPARLAVPRPGQAFLAEAAGRQFAAALAEALAEQEVPAVAENPKRGDWQVLASAEPRGTSIVPLYTIQDAEGVSRGIAQGVPIPAATWVLAQPPMLKEAAADAAPRLASLLTRIEAQRRQSDPNSLLNRPTQLGFIGVTGAPGDGNTTLARQMRLELKSLGQTVQDSATGADFTMQGKVVVVPIAGGQVRVEIQWLINDAKGSERGRVVQLNDIPAGTLDHFWGDVAVVVAHEAAGGVKDVLLNQTGAKR